MAEFTIFFRSLSLSHLGLNWLDLIILAVFLFYSFEGFTVGFLAAFFDLCNFVISFLAGLKFYGVIGSLLSAHIALPVGFAHAIGFFLASFLVELVLSFLLRKPFLFTQIILLRKGEKQLGGAYLVSLNKFMGMLPGIASAYVLLAFLLTTIMSLPFSLYLKHSVTASHFGSLLVVNTQSIEKQLSSVFGGALTETLNFLTVKPEGDEVINLHFTVAHPVPDERAEDEMVHLVNEQRERNGLAPVEVDDNLRDVARAHSKDMLVRGYFSHYTPEGLSPFDRLGTADISYTYAGENLALAPQVTIAMQGLMNSPGHRANILSPNFRKIGIGVMDGGVYGQMFSQEFTD